MIKVFAANVVVSKGFNDETIKVSTSGDCVRFRIGEKKYDSRADDNTRWVNVTVKALGEMAERVKKMKLKAGSNIIISGDLDIESWVDEEKEEKKSAPVILLTSIEYQFGGSGGKSTKSEDDEDEEEAPKPKAKGKPSTKKQAEESDNFDGYESYGNGFWDN